MIDSRFKIILSVRISDRGEKSPKIEISGVPAVSGSYDTPSVYTKEIRKMHPHCQEA